MGSSSSVVQKEHVYIGAGDSVKLVQVTQKFLNEIWPSFTQSSLDLAREITSLLEKKLFSPGDLILGNEGEFFGELSVLYNLAGTTSVKAQTNCTAYLLMKHEAEQIFEHADILPAAKWCIKRKYLESPHGLPDLTSAELARMIAVDAISQAPLFRSWSGKDLSDLLFKSSPVGGQIIIYPKGGVILSERDPCDGLVILIRGSAAVSKVEEHKHLINVCVWKWPFVFNEEGLFYKRPILLKVTASSPCWVIKVQLADIEKTVHENEIQAWQQSQKLWRLHLDKFLPLPLECQPDAQIEIMVKYLNEGNLSLCSSPHDAYQLCLCCDPAAISSEESVVFETMNEGKQLLVLYGDAILQSRCANATIATYHKGSVIDTDLLQEDVSLTADKASLLVTLPTECAKLLMSGLVEDGTIHTEGT